MEKDALSSDWGTFSTIKVNYIYINRIWINTGNKLTSTKKYIILFGMVNTMKTFLRHRKCLNDFRVIPEKAKEDIKHNNPENFNKTLINVTAEQEGAKYKSCRIQIYLLFNLSEEGCSKFDNKISSKITR